LHDLDTQRDNYLKLRAKSQQIEVRLGATPVQLGGYLEQAAKDAGVEITESNEEAPAQTGNNFVQRTVGLRLKAVTLEQLVKFMRAIETGRNLVVVTSLHITTRDDKHQQLDVDMAVSTFQRDLSKGGAKKGEKS
jgi:hypothetical protein